MYFEHLNTHICGVGSGCRALLGILVRKERREATGAQRNEISEIQWGSCDTLSSLLLTQ